jgi:hypothetical protein
MSAEANHPSTSDEPQWGRGKEGYSINQFLPDSTKLNVLFEVLICGGTDW